MRQPLLLPKRLRWLSLVLLWLPLLSTAVPHLKTTEASKPTVARPLASNPDTDRDGIPDATEGTGDADGDGRNNSNDLDSDNDGIPDAVEANNGVLDPDMSADGRYPALYVTLNDSDLDGLVNKRDPDTAGFAAFVDLDQDGDGLRNRLDRDSDNDGLTDAREANAGALRPDITTNGVYNPFTDTDTDGIDDNVDPNNGGTALPLTNTDGTGRPDFLDIDADDDGITDWYEAQNLVRDNTTTSPWIRDLVNTDSDGDGILNNVDPNGGLALVPVDSDGDGTADYRDLDADNDGVSDRIEWNDADHDGVADVTYATTDTDNDGLVNVYDSENNTSGTLSNSSGFNNIQGPATPAGGVTDYGMLSLRPNADFDYLLDWRDTDDDNDGTLTSAEAVGGNYLVYTQGGYYTQRRWGTTPVIVNEPDYLHMKRSGSPTPDKRTAVLDWNYVNPFDGSPGGNQPNAYLSNKSFTVAGVTVTIANFSTTGTPATTTITQVGTPPQTGGNQTFGATYPKNPILETDKFLLYGDQLSQGFFQTLGTNGAAGGQSIARYTFSQPLRAVTMGLIDLDAAVGSTSPAGYEDDVEIVGYRNGVAVTLGAGDISFNNFTTDVTGAATPALQLAGTSTVAGSRRVVGNINAPGTVPTKQQAANVWVSFAVPIDELRVIYRNAGARTGVQIVSLGEFRFTNTDFDGDNVADITDLDTDNDGIPDLTETGNVNVFADADSDGIPNYMDSDVAGWVDTNTDGIDDRYDRDLDGLINPMDRDADNDGISDTREAGGTDANGDGILDGFVDANADGKDDTITLTPANTDGDTLANYLDIDSDNDGITDAREARMTGVVDANNNGIADAYAATSPDLNLDGIADAVVTTSLPADFDGDGRADYADRDSDNDGITDVRESGGTDANGDGAVDGFADANGDGLNGGAGNTGITPTDFDGDTVANYLDRDSDNDGITDAAESYVDANNNGISDAATADTNSDGLYDAAVTATAPRNSDGTGNPNYLDRDSDDDGLVDAIEGGGLDANGDGIVDSFVTGSTNGVTNTISTPADTDTDGFANYVDRDSDSDGIWDLLEIQATSGRRALANADNDGDGIDNNFDNNFTAGFAITTPLNKDAADVADYLDQDSDNDGAFDWTEGFDDTINGYALDDLRARAATFASNGGNATYYPNATDTNLNGIPDWLDDADADNIPNFLDFGNTYYRDGDNDGLVDLYDTDSFGAASTTPTKSGDADAIFRTTGTLAPLAVTLTGTVFEDFNYGGGAGRTLAASGGYKVGRLGGLTSGTVTAGATVELYDASGNFVATTTTSTAADATLGTYSFSVAPSTAYTVRVVNTSVRSGRTGSASGLIPVQTYNGTATKVGGEAPEKTDAAANTSASLSTLTPSGGTTAAQSIFALTTGASGSTGVDFGFNFDLVVNTRDAGQGSLRQFIVNSNTLGNEAGLTQAGSNPAGTLTPGKESSIFMIPNGSANAGQLAGLVSGLSSGVAVITPTALLPAISGPDTYLDGSTQTQNIANSNNVTLGAGGTVGTTPTALGTVNGPEVQLVGSTSYAVGVDIASGGTGAGVFGLAIYGFGTNGNNNNSGEIRVGAGGALISRNVIGTSATAFADLGAGVRGVADGIRFVGTTTASTVSNNLIGYNGGKGIGVNAASSNVSVTNNEVRSNALNDANWDGLDFEGSSNSATFNLFVNNSGQGVDTFNSTGSNTITDNTVSGNGRGIAAGPGETPGIRIFGNSNTVSRNVINGNYGAGILVNNTSATTTISQNSIFNNGTVTAVNGAAATGQIGIDLNNGATSTGVSPFVTLNDLNDSDGGANGLLNYPILQTAYISGSNLVVTGYARPGSLVEFFVPSADPTGFGEGQTYLTSATEGTAGVDTNTGTGTYGPANINGLAQGTDNTNLFTFSLALTSAQIAAIQASGLTSTATLSGATSEFSGNLTLSNLVGNVFEDLNYGGGAGRSIATANAATSGSAVNVGTAGTPATAATVELYDASGNFLATTQTSTTAGTVGQYSFSVAAGNYQVRVVNSTVRSTRTGSVAGLVPVQTYNGTTTSVGGRAPERTDAAANSGSQTLAALTTGTGLTGFIAQSVASVTASGSTTTGPDFGFNFDLVVNTRDAGQGSLRQFITNANNLTGETSLAQAGSNTAGTLPAQRETSIFMIPNGAANAGQLAGLTPGLTSGVAVITPLTAYPQITGVGTIIDGSTQTTNIANSNSTTLGTGTTVGTAATTLSQVPGPEVRLSNGAANISLGLDFGSAASNSGVRGLSIYGFGNTSYTAGSVAEIRSAASGFTLAQNVIGSGPAAVADPAPAGTTRFDLVYLTGANASVSNNLLVFGTDNGVNVAAGATSASITNNEINNNGRLSATADGVVVAATTATINGNLLTNTRGAGVNLVTGGTTATVTNNTVSNNGRGTTTAVGTTAGIQLATTGNTISTNVITNNYGAGIAALAATGTSTFSQNSISTNGTSTANNGAAATGGIGIDLNNNGVTINDLLDLDTGANGLQNFPVIETAYFSGNNLVVNGFAQPGAVVEFFLPAADPSNFGEGQTFLASATEGSGADTNGGTGTYTNPVNGLNQGTETTNRFTFSFPLTAAQRAAVLASGLTSTATVGGATSEFSGNTALVTIKGTVFEDPNYGGGSGRSLAASSGVPVGTAGNPATAATVELYDAGGNIVATTTTSTTAGSLGQYTFSAAPGSYTVRVVSNTVRSSRPGSVAGLLPVQTFRTNNGAADVDRVGGEAPEKADAVTSGPQTLSFTGGNGGGDNTAFVDLVEILDASNNVVTGLPLNPSFETPSLGTGNFQYDVTGASWTFNSRSGIAANGSAFNVGGTNPVAPDGTQVALVQTAGGLTGSFSQGLGLSPGTYTVRFRAAQRTTNSQSLTVAVNGIALGTFTPANSTYTTFTTGSFTVGTPTTLASLNTATSVAQSIAPLTLTGAGATGIDFGYNFSTVVNTNDSGQGSLRQFLTNSNALTNTGLDQVASSNGGLDPAAGKEYSIFMISDGAAHAGLRSGLVNQLTGASGSARAVITLPGTGTLPVSDANTVLYGQSQTLNVGDTNTGTLGNGGTVGTDAVAFNAENKPEVEIAGNNVGVVFSLTGAAATMQGLAVRGGNQTISINGSAGFLLQNNIIGSSATAFTWANDGTVSAGFGVNIFGGANGSILDNLIGFTGNSGVNVNNGVNASLITVRDNEFTQNGYTSAGGDGISLGDGGGAGPMLIENNLFTRSNSSAVQFEIGSTSSTIVRNNTIVSAGRGGAGFALSQLEGSAICYLSRNGTQRTRTGVTDLIEKNIIVDTQASGIVIGYGSQNTVISQNSIYNSGSVAIDFNTNPNAYVNGAGSGAVEYGSGDGVTINDGNDPATAPSTLANKGVDYPVLTTIDLAGSTLTVSGFSRPSAVIEFFIPELDPTRFGEGRTYLATRTEGVSDLDSGTGSYGPGAINGVMQGTDAAANRFRFTISVAGLTPAQLTQLQNVGVTSTATLLNSTSEFSPNVPFSSDVLATITAAASLVAAGQTATFNVTFNNLGGSTASGVVATVQLPAGLTGVTVTGGSYNSTTGLVSYPGITTLNPSTPQTSTITYTQPVNSPSVTGVAAVSTTTNQNGATANDSQSATITTGPAFDLLTTIGGPASTVAGQLTTYAVTTQNNGPGAAPNAVQTVTLPTTAALTNVFVSNGGTYSFSAGTSTFTFPVPATLPQGQVVNNFFSFTSPLSGPLSLTATVTPSTTGAGDTNTSNNTATLSTTVNAAPATQANVYTTISSNATNGSAAPAAAVTYTVTQGNNGPSAATGVVTQVALSPNLTTTGFTVNGATGTVSGSNINFTITGGTATYSQTTGLLTLPTIASQASSASTTYTVVAPAPNSGQLTVTSSVSTTTADPVPADNEAATLVTVTNALTADLATTIVGPSTATAGQSVTYTVTTSNNGPGTAQNVVQTVNIPAGLAITGGNAVRLNGAAPTSTSGTTATYAGGITYNAATGVVTITAPTGVSGPGTSASNTITYQAPVNSGSLTNVAVVRGTSPDGVTTNNTASVTTTVQTQADVAVYLSGPTSSTVGSPITFAVTTVNNGPSISNSETTTVQLPSGLSGVEIRGYDGAVLATAYNSTSGVVTFPTVTNQAAGSAGTVVGSITFNTPNTTVITPSATAAVGSNVDPNLGNNVASLSVGIQPATTTTIDLVASFNVAPPATATAGASITYTVRAANATATATTGVVQDVFLNAGLATTGFTVGGAAGTLSGDIITFPGGATYSQTTGVLSIPVGNLAASAGVNTAIVQPAPGSGPYAITSTVRGNDTDTNTGNNRVTNSVTITPSVDVATTVTGPATAAIGSTVTYAVVTTNNGPSPASNVVQTVTLPAGATSVVITGGGTLSGSTVTFPTINNMAVGSAGTITNSVSFTVPNTTPSITVTGNVTATGDAGTTGNNTSSQVTTTQPNRPPVASDVVNVLQTPEGNTAVTQLPISPLQATDADGNATIVTYTVTSIPNAGTQGTLYYNSSGSTYTAVTAGQTLTPTQAATLRFLPVTGYVGNVFFTYTATDNGNGVPANALSSNTATYTIQVGQDNPAVYTVAPPKGGTTNPYANNDILASVIDPNGAQYTSAGLITYNAATGALATGDNGTRTVVLTTGPLPAGTTLNPTTGLITVTDYTQLVPGSYPLTITTTDVFGGVTVHNIVVVIGGSPIAVDDFATTNLNTAVTFAVAANDLPNGGAAINPATIDLDPTTAGIQTSITTALGTFTTVGAPMGSVTFTPASPTFTGTATTPYVISNSATPAAVSNQANLVVTVRGPLPVDLSTTISAATNPVNAGASETLTVTATNNSTTTASANTVLTVQLPAGLTTTGFTVSGAAGTLSGSTITFPTASYNQTTGLLSYTSTTLAATATTTSAIVFPAPAASFTATSQVGNGTIDPTPANNTASVNVTVNPQFDLVTTLDGPASVVTGDLATFTVVSRNNGPSAVSNAVQTVQLPTGLSGVFITGGGYYNATAGSQTLYYVNGLFTTTNPGSGATAYTLAAGGVIFPPASLSSGQAIANSISFAPTAGFSPSALITPNTAPAGETSITNNTAYLNGAASLTPVTVTGATANSANVYLTVTGPATVAAGGSASYTVTQGNNGPNTAANVTTTVSLPTGLTTATLTLSGTTGTSVAGNVITFTGGANNGATYDTQTGVLTLPTLGTQASAATPQSYTIGITAPNTGTFNVTGSVATATTDPVPGDNVASVMTTITPAADVAIGLSGPASATAGQPLSYTVQLTNNSGIASQGVTATLNLPAGLSTTGFTVGGSTGTLSGTTITFPNGSTYNTQTGVLTLNTLATLPANGTQSTAIVFTAPGTTGSLNLTGTVSATTPDGVLSNNRATLGTTLAATADVVVAVSGPATAIAGNTVSYVVQTTNNGPSTAAGYTTTVQLPTGLTGVVVRNNSGAIVAGAYNATTGVVTFAAVANLQPGAVQTGVISFPVPATVSLNVAAVASPTAATNDPNLDNNRATVVTAVSPAPTTAVDVAVTLARAGANNRAPGANVGYTLTVSNNTAGTPAPNVTRQVLLPAGLTISVNGTSSSQSGDVVTYTGGVNTGTTYNTRTGVLTFPVIASLVNGTNVAVGFTVVAPDNGPVSALATAGTSATETDLTNNTAQVSLGITQRSDVATYLTAPATAAAGSPVTYTVVTANNGPTDVTSLVQTVNLPAGATGISAPVGATVSGTTVTYTVSNLTSGSSQTNTITFTMPNTASVTGTASVPVAAYDLVAANNTASATTTLPNQAPVAQDVVNTLQSPEGNTANAPLPISPLSGADTDGTVDSYTVLTLPTAAQGVLYVWNGTTNVVLNTTNFPGLVLTPTQAQNLRFDPAATFAGTVNFTYQATDNLGAVSNTGRYTIQSGIDNASTYATTPVKTNTNTNPYVTNDVLAYVVDPNGAQYNSAGAIYNMATGVQQSGTSNGLAPSGTNAVLAPTGPAGNPTNVLPSGVSLNPSTGQIYVSNASLLPAITTNTSYSVNITTTDVYGGVTTQTVTFTLGAFPLPVELTVFTAQAVRNVDGLLKWSTASEKNNDHFDVERSVNGRDFTKFAEVKGQGTKASPTDYVLTDANAAKLAGTVYYRLRQVDADGTSSYSPVRTVAFTKATTPSISLYPNPAVGETTLDLSQLPTGTYQVSLIDATGRTIVGLSLEAGLTHTVDLHAVADGTYMLLLQGRSQDGQSLLLTKRLIKQ